MNVVEVGIKLEKNIDYYDNLLKEKGFINDFNCVTHDIYYTNKKLDGLTENQMKNSCIRFRNKLSIIDKIKMCLKGNKKIFDTIKEDHHYSRQDLKSKIQLQEIKDIGLVVYYDNPDYYDLSVEEQWDKLINELNSYGFDFYENTIGIDKLRTLYYKKEMYSKNQNG